MKHIIVFFALITVPNSCKKEEKLITPSSNNDTTTIVKDTTQSLQNKNRNDSITCSDVVLKILTTAPAYTERTKGLYEAIVKNGGTSFGITVEGSPNPEKDNALNYSKTYDLNLHETYPDRMVTTARYTFDPAKNELYEYDVAKDTLEPMRFDKKLLLDFRKICK